MDRQEQFERALTQYRSLPQDAPVDTRIDLCRQALAHVGPRTPPRQIANLDLELGFHLLSTVGLGSDENLDEAVDHLESALKRYNPREDWDWWVPTAQNLALAYAWRSDREQASDAACAQDVTRAIKLNKKLVSQARARQAAHAEAHARYQLAQLYVRRLEGDRAANVEAALAQCDQALDLWKKDSEPLRWAMLQIVLGYIHARRLLQDPVENLRSSLAHLEAAIALLDKLGKQRSSDWAEAHRLAGVSFWQLGQLVDDRQACLESAIRHLTLAHEVYQREAYPREWAHTLHWLAVAYSDSNAGDFQQNIALAAGWLDKIKDFYLKYSIKWIKVQIDLAATTLKSVHGGRSESIERAIKRLEGALDATGAAYTLRLGAQTRELRAQILHNLAAAYEGRLLKSRAHNLVLARDYCKQALETVDERDLVQWATIQADLVGIFWRSGTIELAQSARGASACFETAIEHGEALLARPDVQPLTYLCAFACYNLGNAYADRCMGGLEDSRELSVNQEQAIRYFNRALDFYTDENYPHRWANAHSDLGVLYQERRAGDPEDNRRQALSHLGLALGALDPDVYPLETLRVASNLARAHFDRRRWSEACGPFQKAIDAANVLYRASLLRSSKKVELGQVIGLYARAGYALAQEDARLPDAARILEQGRARLLSDALERDPRRLEELQTSDDALAQRYKEIVERIDELSRSEFALGDDYVELALAEQIESARRELDEVVQEIQEDELPEFLTTHQPVDMAATADADAPLIYLSVTPAGSVALIVRPGQIERVLCPMTEHALRAHIWGSGERLDDQSYLGVYARWRKNPQSAQACASWFQMLSQTTRWLWDVLVGDIVDALIERGIHRAALITQSWLGLLPLHAAWTDEVPGTRPRRSAMDEVRFSYAPNARALLAARQVLERVETERLLVIQDPNGSLRYSHLEATAVCQWFDECDLLAGAPATEQATVEKLRECSVVHFSCHGSAGFSRPLEGGLHLANKEKLTLREILSLRLQDVRLAVLSACETGIPGTELPDEVISLPTGLIQAGVAGVVGSLWAVADVSTTMLMTRFYELWKGCGKEPPDALREAQVWLRDTTNGERAEHYKRSLPEFGGHAPEWLLPVAHELYRRSVQGNADKNDFAHPFYWAAFTYTGA